MADIIDFDTKNMTSIIDSDTLIKDILKELIKESHNIQELIVLVRDKANNRTMFHTDTSVEDKAVFIQLLQHDIFSDLSPTEEVGFEPDL